MARQENLEVAEQLRGDILGGQFAPGERLVELQLTERYGAGRAAVRAALVELAAEGLIEREANRGASVRQISIDEAVEITEARAALESLLASAAARRATADERTELAELEAEMRRAVVEERFLDYSELNGLLHRRIREIGAHQIAAELVAQLRNRSARHQYRLALMPGRPVESLEQHADIIRAVVDGDEAGAAAAMQSHLLSVIEVLRHWDGEVTERSSEVDGATDRAVAAAGD
jgi:DNA-binding GntR family transcriptional regulator